MNECTTLHTECNNAYERLARAAGEAAEAFYDLAESAKFHCGRCVGAAEQSEPQTDVNSAGEASESGRHEPAVEPEAVQLEFDLEPDRSIESEKKALVTAKPEHRATSERFKRWNDAHPRLPNVLDMHAIAARLKGSGPLATRAIVPHIRTYCAEKGLSQITSVGMRYLLYSAGVKHMIHTGTTYFIF